MAYRPPASQWDVSVKAPDLSNVVKMARNTGRNSAIGDFYENLVSEQKKAAAEAKKAADKEKTAAAEDLGNEPESQSFWDKLGQNAGDAMWRTLDILSRPMYTVSGVFDEANSQAYQNKKGNLGDVLKAGWDGFMGRDKEDFMALIKREGAKDPGKDWRDNKWAQAGVGLGMDIFADPTTYIGLGFVTKPFKAANEIKGVKAVEQGTVNDLVGLGLKKEVDGQRIPITADQYRSILGESRNINARPAAYKSMKWREKRAWDKAHTLKGIRVLPRSEAIATQRQRIQNLDDVYKAIKESPEIEVDASEAIRKLIDDTQSQLATAVDAYGKRAYRSALTKFDEAKALDGVTNGVVKRLDEVVSVNRIRTGLRAERLVSQGKSVVGNFDNGAMSESALSFLKSPRLSDEFRANWKEKLKVAVGERSNGTKSKYFQAVDDIEGYNKEIARRTKELAGVGKDKGFNSAEYKTLNNKLKGYEKQRREAYDARDVAQAETLHRLVAEDANLKAMRDHPDFAARTFDLEEQLAHVEKNMARLDEMAMDRHAAVVPSAKQDAKAGLESESLRARPDGGTVDEVGQETGYHGGEKRQSNDEYNDLKSERAALKSELSALEHRFYRDNPDQAFFNSKVSDAPIIHKPGPDATAAEHTLWEKAKEALVVKRRKEIYDQKVATEGRKLRSDKGPESKLIETLTGGKGDGVLRLRSGHSLKDRGIALNKFVIKADKVAAKKVNPDGTRTPAWAHAFNRIFKKETGYTVEEASAKIAAAEGKVVKLGKKNLTKKQYVDAIVADPVGMARMGHGIPIPRHLLPETAGLKNQERVSFAKWSDYVITQKEMTKLQAQRAWDHAFGEYVTKTPDKAKAAINSNWEFRYNREVNKAKGLEDVASPLDNPALTAEMRQELKVAAEKEAQAEVDAMDKVPNLTNDVQNHHLPSQENLDIEAEHKLLVQQMKRDFAEKERMLKLNNPDPRSKPAGLIKELHNLQLQFDEEVKAAQIAFDEAKRARDAMEIRLKEDIDLNALDEAIREGQNYLRVSMGRVKLMDVYMPQHMLDAVEKMSGLPLIKQTRQAWSQAFKPSSSLEPEMNLSRLRAQSETANIIKHHLQEMKDKFSAFKPKDRTHALRLLREGKSPVGDLGTKLDGFFKDYARYTTGMVHVGDEPLTIHEINSFIPEPFKFIHPKGGNVNELNLNSSRNILKAMESLPKDADPMKVMWALRIAAEQAMAKKALQHTIKQTFGIKRIMKAEHTLETANKAKLVEAMHTEHDWVQNINIGATHYFPRDVSEQIDTLFKMTKPQEVHKIMRGFDKSLRVWKSSVTVYNPGYYTRNAIGEFTMNVFDNVGNITHYKRAASILSHKMPDSTKEALKKMEPWKNRQTDAQLGSRHAATLMGGHKLTNDDVWILYNDVGLKSGFISTEFDHLFPSAGSVKASHIGQGATKINDSMRWFGEKQEDYYRLTHFISRLERSLEGKFTAGASKEIKDAQILKAAEDASEYVRKFHFDYTDFTPFEKATMLRLIPFYKWTRKAMPLMASMLFTQPGKVLLYPKAMSALSVGTGATDPATDTNGFEPNYEKVVPEWIRSMGGYPIGTDFPADPTGAMTYMNVATPAFDVYKMMQHPISTTIGMMNPFAKLLLEQGSGDTLDPSFDIKFKDVPGSRQDNIARITPATSLMDKISQGDDTSQTWASFISGLGFYQNSIKRQEGEKMRQNFDK